jgi:hypothetical protein
MCGNSNRDCMETIDAGEVMTEQAKPTEIERREDSDFWMRKLNKHLLDKQDAWGLEFLRNYMRELYGETEERIHDRD